MKLIQEMKAEEKLQQQQSDEQMKSDEQYAIKLSNENKSHHNNPNNNVTKLNDDQWSCQYCTFINDIKTNICSMCNKTTNIENSVSNANECSSIQIHKEEQKAAENENVDEKWSSIYQELESKYLSKDQCAKYYSAFLDIVTKNRVKYGPTTSHLCHNSVIHYVVTV